MKSKQNMKVNRGDLEGESITLKEPNDFKDESIAFIDRYNKENNPVNPVPQSEEVIENVCRIKHELWSYEYKEETKFNEVFDTLVKQAFDIREFLNRSPRPYIQKITITGNKDGSKDGKMKEIKISHPVLKNCFTQAIYMSLMQLPEHAFQPVIKPFNGKPKTISIIMKNAFPAITKLKALKIKDDFFYLLLGLHSEEAFEQAYKRARKERNQS